MFRTEKAHLVLQRDFGTDVRLSVSLVLENGCRKRVRAPESAVQKGANQSRLEHSYESLVVVLGGVQK